MNHYRKYVHKLGNRWGVQKHINGKLKTFKAFNTIAEAISYRDQLIANNWQEPPKTDEEIQAEKTREYYKHIHINRCKRKYVILNKNSKYIGTVETIEEALYYRDLYVDCPLPVPRPSDVDLTTDNPYLIDGLMFPLPERLRKDETPKKYGQGSIQQRSKTSYRVLKGKTKYATCRTYEQAYYVRKSLQECNWDKSKVPQILADYPKWYTWLMRFYQYVGKKDGKWYVGYPKQYCGDKIERINYRNIEDALFERDWLMANEWDYETLVYVIDDSDNPYYDMDLPPYPERKITNIKPPKDFKSQLNRLQDLIQEGVFNQEEAAMIIGVTTVTIRNWLRNYDTDWKSFIDLVLSGEDIWTVLSEPEYYYTPDLSPSMPSNYTGYVHKTQSKRSPYCVARKGEYYGAYKDKKMARSVVNELRKVNWDKSKLKEIQEKVGHEQFLNTKRWVYPNSVGKSWYIRKKDKTRKMIYYGSYTDKRVADMVRDLLVENDWDKSRLDEFRKVAEEYYMEAEE